MCEDIVSWDHTKNYKKGDVVYYFEHLFKCRKDTQGHPEDEDWYDPTECDEYGTTIEEISK